MPSSFDKKSWAFSLSDAQNALFRVQNKEKLG